MVQLRIPAKNIEAAFAPGTKLLAAAIELKTGIRYGCGACRCGTCGVRVLSSQESLSPMGEDEKELLSKMRLSLGGEIRLACQARLLENAKNLPVEIDLGFQNEYNPDPSL